MSGNVFLSMDKYLPRSLLFVFKDQDVKHKCVSDNASKSITTDRMGKVHDCLELFSEFIDNNKGCFWDPHLEESLLNVNINGFIFPSAVLVTGRDIHLDTIARAWSKRILRSTHHFQLEALGISL